MADMWNQVLLSKEQLTIVVLVYRLGGPRQKNQSWFSLIHQPGLWF